MAEQPQRKASALFGAIGSLLSDWHWQTVATSGPNSLSITSSPWGKLIKFDLRQVLISDALAARDVFIRPEVRDRYRSMEPLRLCISGIWRRMIRRKQWQVLSPGTSMVEIESFNFVHRKLMVFFGDAEKPFRSMFFRSSQEPVLTRQELRRDYPEEGDATMGWFQMDGDGSSLLYTMRNEAEKHRFRNVLIFKVSYSQFAKWSPHILKQFVDLVAATVGSYMNRPGIGELRTVNAKFYLLLALRNFNRGPPMLPEKDSRNSCTTISTGKPELSHWSRFRVEAADKKFHLADYLTSFLQCLGLELDIYGTLDGRTLVPYQCVVERSAWEGMKEAFQEAFRLQRTAYRRANGGSAAPALMEDMPPRFAQQHLEEEEVVAPEPLQVVVRKTFIELHERLECPLRLMRSRSERIESLECTDDLTWSC